MSWFAYFDLPRAAALCARVAKVPFETLPPLERAAADWIALARVGVIAVVFPLLAIFCILLRKGGLFRPLYP